MNAKDFEVMNFVADQARQLGEAQGHLWLATYFVEKALGYMTDEHGGDELKAEMAAYLERRKADKFP